MNGKTPGFYSPTLAAAPRLCLSTRRLWGKGNYIPRRAVAHSSSWDCNGAILVPLDGSVGRTVISQCPLGPDLSHPESATATRPPSVWAGQLSLVSGDAPASLDARLSGAPSPHLPVETAVVSNSLITVKAT